MPNKHLGCPKCYIQNHQTDKLEMCSFQPAYYQLIVCNHMYSVNYLVLYIYPYLCAYIFMNIWSYIPLYTKFPILSSFVTLI